MKHIRLFKYVKYYYYLFKILKKEFSDALYLFSYCRLNNMIN